MVTQEEAVRLLREVVQTNSISPPGNELAVAQILKDFFAEHGIDAKVDEFSPGRANLLARLSGSGERGAFMLCGHMDVVPVGDVGWTVDPFGGVLDGDRLFGRGACDMKSGLVAMVVALVNLRHRTSGVLPGDVVFVATAGEEVDCCGARRLVDQRVLDPVEALVIGEPTREEVLIAHKGALWLEIETLGRTAHGSMPHKGINAVVHMYRVLDRLLQDDSWYGAEDEMMGRATLTVSRIDGGVKVNVVPDRCVLQMDVRTVAGQDQDSVVRKLKGLLEQISHDVPDFRYDVRVISRRTAVRSPADARVVHVGRQLHREFYGTDVARSAAPYFTDASVFVDSYPTLPVLFYGPGDDALAHQPDEWVSIEAFLRSIDFYQELILRHFLVPSRAQVV